jgi:hypothetical protein
LQNLRLLRLACRMNASRAYHRGLTGFFLREMSVNATMTAEKRAEQKT